MIKLTENSALSQLEKETPHSAVKIYLKFVDMFISSGSS